MNNNLNEFRDLINTNPEEAVKQINEKVFNKGLDTSGVQSVMGFSWNSINDLLLTKGYKKRKGKNGIIEKLSDINNIDDNKNIKEQKDLKLTQDEIRYLKELCKNRTIKEEEKEIGYYSDKTKLTQKSVMIDNSLIKEINDIYSIYRIYKKQDVFNEIIRRGIDSLKK